MAGLFCLLFSLPLLLCASPVFSQVDCEVEIINHIYDFSSFGDTEKRFDKQKFCTQTSTFTQLTLHRKCHILASERGLNFIYFAIFALTLLFIALLPKDTPYITNYADMKE